MAEIVDEGKSEFVIHQHQFATEEVSEGVTAEGPAPSQVETERFIASAVIAYETESITRPSRQANIFSNIRKETDVVVFLSCDICGYTKGHIASHTVKGPHRPPEACVPDIRDIVGGQYGLSRSGISSIGFFQLHARFDALKFGQRIGNGLADKPTLM